MKDYNKRELAGIISALEDIYDTESTVEAYPRVGDKDTPLSITKAIDDEEHRTVVIVWGDGTSTKSVADPKDEYDFAVGFGLCIAKKFVKNLGRYAEAVYYSNTRCIHIKKDPANTIEPAKSTAKKKKK